MRVHLSNKRVIVSIRIERFGFADEEYFLGGVGMVGTNLFGLREVLSSAWIKARRIKSKLKPTDPL